MPSSLSERLSLVRHHQFVGRRLECDFFKTAVLATEMPFAVLHIFGPGGIGKTMLLYEFSHICADSLIPTLYLDARDIEPTPESFLTTLQNAIQQTDNGFQQQNLLNKPIDPDSSNSFKVPTSESEGRATPIETRQVIFIDTYEILVSIDNWFRDEFLPQLSAQTMIVLAGRYPPKLSWRTDLGWQTLLYSLSLRNLNPTESQEYLAQRAIPTHQHHSILEFTHGYPLALSLIADVYAQTQSVSFRLEATPDIVKALLEKFLEDVPTSFHRKALEACAIIRISTEKILEQMLSIEDTYELFSWLEGLSFFESGQIGIFPHDLVRDVLIADLRWRNPDRYAELHQLARTYYMSCLEKMQAQDQHQILADYIFLHRDNPAIKLRFTWQEQSSLLTDILKPSDIKLLLAMVTNHEGEESSRIAAYWLERQPDNVLVFRNLEQQPVGFIQMVVLNEVHFEDIGADPAAIASWRYLQKNAPLRKSEVATLFRFWMGRDTYQVVSPVQSLIFISLVQYYRTHPGLAFTFLPCAEPEYWSDMFAYADLSRLFEADFEVGGHHYGVYGHDWRVIPPATWQELLARREIASSAAAISSEQVNDCLLVLSQTDFAAAIKEALRDYHRPDFLRNNPILRSRLIAEQSVDRGESNRVLVLQTLLQETITSLQSSPRHDRFYRALYRTYLQPASTQEQAAEALDIPFSTYRRHLKNGVLQVIDILWQKEIS